MSVRYSVAAQRTQISRRALEGAATAMASVLRDLGVRSGYRVGVCGENSVEYVVQIVALAWLDCSVAIIDPRVFRSASNAVSQISLDYLIFPRHAPKGWLDVDGDAVLRVDDLVRIPSGEILEWARDKGQTPFPGPCLDNLEEWPWCSRPDGLIQMTSGSTGKPQIVPKRPALFLSNMRRTHRRLEYRSDDVLAPILPLSHQYGLSLLMLGLLLDITVAVVGPERVRDAVRLARRFGATVVDATPQVHDVIMREYAQGRLSDADLRCVRYWCVGGGPITSVLQQRAWDMHGRFLLDGYGSTELGNVAHVSPAAPTHMVPLDGIELRVVDQQGSPAEPGAWGPLYVRTPDSEEEGWQSTGDLAMLTEDGGLVVGGRARAVDRNGLLVYPAALERMLGDHGISGVCVVSGRTTDRRRHDRLVMVIEDRFRRRHGEWAEIVSDILPEASRPDRIVVRDRLPRTHGTEKVDRAAVAAWVEALERGSAVDTKIAAALGRDKQWFVTRARAIRRVAEYIRTHRAEMLTLMEDYCSREAALIEIDATLTALDGAVAETLFSGAPCVPRGWVHMPSNVLLYGYALYLIVPSLSVQSLIFRPSSRSHDAMCAIHDRLAPVHGLPIDLADVSQSQFMELRGENPGLLIFTGRYANAEEVRRTIASCQLMLFFGQGTNPVVVGREADVAVAARESVAIRVLNSGQDCFGPDVLFVHRSVADDFLLHVEAELDAREGQEIRPADPMVVREVVEHVSTHRSRVARGGSIDLAQLAIDPTVLIWDIKDVPRCSEIFAPVFNVVIFDEYQEVADALGSEFYRERSMCASLYGTSTDFATWCAEYMTVSLGCSIVATDDPNQSFGGVGRMANFVAHAEKVLVGPLLVSEALARYWPWAVSVGENGSGGLQVQTYPVDAQSFSGV